MNGACGFYGHTGRERRRPARSPAPATHSQEAAAGSGEAAAGTVVVAAPDGFERPPQRRPEKCLPSGWQSQSWQATRGPPTDGARAESLFLTGTLHPPVQTPVAPVLLLTSGAGPCGAASQSSVPTRSLRELEEGFSLFYSFQVCGTPEAETTRNRASRDGS